MPGPCPDILRPRIGTAPLPLPQGLTQRFLNLFTEALGFPLDPIDLLFELFLEVLSCIGLSIVEFLEGLFPYLIELLEEFLVKELIRPGIIGMRIEEVLETLFDVTGKPLDALNPLRQAGQGELDRFFRLRPAEEQESLGDAQGKQDDHRDPENSMFCFRLHQGLLDL